VNGFSFDAEIAILAIPLSAATRRLSTAWGSREQASLSFVIVIGLGAGGEARRPLGITVVGGMLFSTFLTLVLVPVVYTLMARFTAKQPVEHTEMTISEKAVSPSAVAMPTSAE